MSTRWWAALVVAWLSGSFAFVGNIQPGPLLPFAVSCLALIAIVALLSSWRWGLWCTTIAIACYTALWLWLERETGNPATVLAVAIAFGGAFWISRRLTERLIQTLHHVWELHHKSNQLLEFDEVTGMYKREQGLRVLADGLEVCRRYHRPLTVVRLGIDNAEEWLRTHGSAQLSAAHRQVARFITENIRTTDRCLVFDQLEYLLVLTETSQTVARSLAHRLAYVIGERYGVDLRLGLAEFPNDGLSVEELVSEAEAALEFARGTNLTVAGQE